MKKKNNRGFTLIELLLVIAIIAILAAIIFVSLGGQRERARVTTFKENMRGLVTTFTACVDGHNSVPPAGTSLNGSGAACPGSTTITGALPTVSQCSGSGNVSLNSVSNGGSDNWSFTATCNRSTGGSCAAICTSDGCLFCNDTGGSVCGDSATNCQ
jgi:prepilin-type N-terminal cleavage/methylation domain-containing protein